MWTEIGGLMGQAAATDAINTPEFFARLARCDRDAVGILFREYAGAMMDYLLKTKRRHGLAEDGWRDAVAQRMKVEDKAIYNLYARIA
jgi:hypothetical protein